MKKLIIILSIIINIILISCVDPVTINEGEEFFRKRDWDKAVEFFIKALNKEPDNVKFRLLLSNALISASKYHFNKGNIYFKENKLTPALIEYEKALDNNPLNSQARTKKIGVLERLEKIKRSNRKNTEIEKIKKEAKDNERTNNILKDKQKRYKLSFSRIDLKKLFKILEKTSKISILFDEGFKSKNIHLNEEDVTLLKLLDKIMLQSRYFYKIIDPYTILIIPDTPAKRKKYEELVMKTFYLSDGDPEQIRKIIKNIAGIKNISINKDLNSLTVKDTLQKVKLAEEIVEDNDKSKGELLIDLDIIEVNKTRAKEYGIDLSQYRITQSYSPTVVDSDTSSTSTGSTINLNDIKYTDASDYILSLPSINYKLLRSDKDSRIKANPHLRVVDGESIKIRIGDKVPIPTTTFVPQYGGSQVNNQPIVSYQLQDIGINIDITPKIHHNGWVTIKLDFELTFISSPGDLEKGTPPTIGNRSVKTIIRLRDNETSMLAGLLRDTERKTLRGLPIVSRIPVLKEIFSGNSRNVEQTDIILTLTPRIIRYPDLSVKNLEYRWVGSFSNPGLKKPPPKFYEILDKEKKKTERKKSSDKKNIKTKHPDKTDTLQEEEKKGVEKMAEIKLKPLLKKLKKNDEFQVSVTVCEIPEGEEVRVIKTDFSFDPEYLEIVELKKGKAFLSKKIEGNLLKAFNNNSGKARINIALKGVFKGKEEEVIVIIFRAKKSGKTYLLPDDFSLFNLKMKRINTKSQKFKIDIL